MTSTSEVQSQKSGAGYDIVCKSRARRRGFTSRHVPAASAVLFLRVLGHVYLAGEADYLERSAKGAELFVPSMDAQGHLRARGWEPRKPLWDSARARG